MLKLNNHTWKKVFLCKKNDTQISGFAVVEKAPSPWKKFYWQKIPSSLFVQVRSSKRYAKMF